jgi:hypothetical protein
LWSGRPARPFARLAGEQYVLTDFRLVRSRGTRVDELVLHDIADVRRVDAGIDRLFGTSTLVVSGRGRTPRTIVLAGIRKGTQLAALIEFLAGYFNVPKRNVRIAAGHKSRRKRVVIEGAQWKTGSAA